MLFLHGPRGYTSLYMQAGDRLSLFVEPFDVTAENKEVTQDRSTEAMAFFLELCGQLLATYKDEVRTIEVLEESGFVMVFEVSLRVPFDDGSYLHVLIFGHKQGTAILDLGISVIEHDPEGNYGSGYMYDTEQYDVLRSVVHADDNETEDDDESCDPKSHFSILDIYSLKGQLADLELSEDEELREAGKETRTMLEERVQFDAWEEEMGFDHQPVSKQELEQLAELLGAAVSFPLSETDPTDDDIIY
jgi:hypothetical protein